MNKIQQKILATFGCYFSDLTLVAWFYYQATNYGKYSQAIGSKLDSPDFQLQFYRIFLQSLTFMLLLFIISQTVVYVLAWRNFRSAYFYLKFFSVFAFAISIYIVFSNSAFATLPAIFYLFGYYVFAKEFKESTAKLQKLHL
ncbi:MAG: hypothetical protein K2Q18_03595 [Bdellovibrionales bacterium]|nr:hypothetical protein [Bdellovibrionales bacterium]